MTALDRFRALIDADMAKAGVQPYVNEMYDSLVAVNTRAERLRASLSEVAATGAQAQLNAENDLRIATEQGDRYLARAKAAERRVWDAQALVVRALSAGHRYVGVSYLDAVLSSPTEEDQ